MITWSKRGKRGSKSLRHWPKGTQLERAEVRLKLLSAGLQNHTEWEVLKVSQLFGSSPSDEGGNGSSGQGNDWSKLTQPDSTRPGTLTSLGHQD